eukprot:871319_1
MSNLFDLLPYAISDLFNRPIFVFNSHLDSPPSLIIGPAAVSSSLFRNQPIIIARNHALNHYENVEPLDSNMQTFFSKRNPLTIFTGPKADNVRISQRSVVTSIASHKLIGVRPTSAAYAAMHNIKHEHALENNSFFRILVMVMLY